ncbi:bifunctional non-homologous end joining protein LigD [Dyella jiangningensis]|uniref:DNA ligase D n=2 Tax=Gammaproteobacteria TaxID=1236 RepID=UPI0008816B9C|nr:DNA ligase D [Dyella sp. AtDHG13]PXV55810.1 ATP-dependent DNA ligase LigD phosphoesterase module /ATP-dependent DNA ligase LigD polymerase module [Dyella sp. AtDHG13]SDK55879.1 bifunctional non-homologous end joining protein LigD [Dyella jiangningensis]
MTLAEYRRKRDFSRTREPAAGTKSRAGHPIFVVQLHHARRRHFDFRLQVGKVLKSWAVPKGPSFDPGVKRLAVEVEDHPLSYADFEGDIPEGNYGAGHVDCFDRGTWSTDEDPGAQLRKGHLEFSLQGKRLHGRWHLVRSHRKERQPTWFLIKAKDAYAGDLEADDLLESEAAPPASERASGKAKPEKRAAASKRAKPAKSAARAADGHRKERIDTEFFAPALAQLREQVPRGEDWLHEVKWDGYRLLTAVVGGKVKCWSRNALPWNERVPEIVEAIESLGLRSARLDGELIVLAEGRSDFNALQKTLSGERPGEFLYMLFDLIHLDGWDLHAVPLVERKARLKALLDRPRGPASALLGFSEHVVGDGDAVWAGVMQAGLEGIVSKRVDSSYRAGRSGDWVKIKRQDSDEFAVVGYTRGKGSRKGFGSLLLGRPSPRGGWDYAGRVGTGFSDAQLRKISDELAARGSSAKPTVHAAGIDPELRGAHWVKPEVVVEVFYRGIAGNGLLRQPSLKAMREDKSVRDLLSSDRDSGRAAAKREVPMKKADDDAVRGIAITHPDREIYPGIRKRDLAAYYDAVMDWFLPGVIQRPMSILRCPDGVGKPCFFQKHLGAGVPKVGSVMLTEQGGKRREYICPDDAASIIELVQFGAVEFHPWGCTAADTTHADRIVFDMDPGEGVSWARVQAAARLARRWLDELGLQSFLRCTGGKGLHVVVPLRPAAPWAEVKSFAKSFAEAMAQAQPEEFIAVSTLSRRKGLIFVDYLRNGRGATSVASYSLRARAGAPVAVPLRWSELGKLPGPAAFDLRTVQQRLRRLRGDPWEGIDTVRQSLGDALRKLDAGE